MSRLHLSPRISTVRLAVAARRDQPWPTPGRFGWDGGYGTSGYTDPREGLIGVLLTQLMMDSPTAPRHFTDFWTGAYAAIDD
jgi:CubicO group peptidase (beta-lactamase class C family)